MEIHNVMEELVASVVEEISRDDAASAKPRYSATEESRMDAICYILNRTTPRYVSSGRGFAHITNELQNDQQLGVDLMRLAHEALHRVSAVRRDFYNGGSAPHSAGPCYNFGTIKGRILDGARFSPVSGVAVTLMRDGTAVEMFDTRWSNPFEIPPQAPGTFNFWPAPIAASDNAATKEFPFELRVEDPRYEPLSHFFSVTAHRGEQETRTISLDRDIVLPDLYLFTR